MVWLDVRSKNKFWFDSMYGARTCSNVVLGSGATGKFFLMARTLRTARDEGRLPNVAKIALNKAGAANKRKFKQEKTKEEKEKRARARQAKKEMKKAPREIVKNSKNHSEVIKGIRNVFRNYKQ